MSAAVRAQGRTMIVTLDHGKVTLAPRWWYRLRHPTIVTRHFYAFEAALVWSPPGLLRLGGQLFFDLSDAYGSISAARRTTWSRTAVQASPTSSGWSRLAAGWRL